MIERNPNHTSAYFSFEGEDSSEHMERLIEIAKCMGGNATTLSGLNKEWLHLSPDELERQRRLDTPVSSIAGGKGYPQASQGLIHRLGFGGISTVRDVLVLGRLKVQRLAGNLPAPQMERLELALESFCPNESYHDQSTPEDVAGLCLSIDQVNASVVEHYATWPAQYPAGRIARLSVAALLEDEQALPEQVDLHPRHDPKVLRSEVLRFAAEFAAARKRLKR